MKTLPPVRGVVPYIDTFSLYCKTVPAWVKGDLELTGARRVDIHRLRGKARQGRYRFELVVQQPRSSTYSVAARFRGAIVHRVHVALDFLTDSRQDADALAAFFREHQSWPWVSPNDEAHDFLGTFYSSWKASTRVAIYSSRPSKIHGRDCCHVEVRFQKAEVVRAVGIAGPLDLVGAERRLAHRRLWLEVVDLEDLGREVARAARHAVEAENHTRTRKVPLPDLDPARDRRRGRLVLGALQHQYLLRVQRAFDEQEAENAAARGAGYVPVRFDPDLIAFPGTAQLIRSYVAEQAAADRERREDEAEIAAGKRQRLRKSTRISSDWPVTADVRKAVIRRIPNEVVLGPPRE